MLRHIYIIRHAEANGMTNGLVTDIDRTLNSNGIENAVNISNQLANNNIKFDKIITSSASRAFHTGVILARNTGFPTKQICICDNLYLTSVNDIFLALQSSEDEFNSICIVAHDPGISDLAYKTGQFLNVKTCGVLHYKTNVSSWNSVGISNLNFEEYIQ